MQGVKMIVVHEFHKKPALELLSQWRVM